MILDIVCFRNKKMKCYTTPQFTQDKLDNLEVNYTRSFIAAGAAQIEKYKSLALYHFGTFDDETGTYNLLEEPELLFDCDDIIASLPGQEA